jgi:hypothetical protein
MGPRNISRIILKRETTSTVKNIGAKFLRLSQPCNRDQNLNYFIFLTFSKSVPVKNKVQIKVIYLDDRQMTIFEIWPYCRKFKTNTIDRVTSNFMVLQGNERKLLR